MFLESVNTSELLRGLAERGVTIFVCVPQFFYLIHQRVMQEVTKASAPKRLIFRSLLAANGALRRVGLNAGRVLFSRVHGVLGGSMRILITGDPGSIRRSGPTCSASVSTSCRRMG